MTEEVQYDVIELHPETGMELENFDSFDNESEAVEYAEEIKDDRSEYVMASMWLQVVRVEGDTRVCIVAEYNAPEVRP